MSTEKNRGIWVQCCHCGHIYHADIKIPIDRLYVTSVCPRCDHEKGLNCGDDINDIYMYCDPVMDERYYQY